MARQMPPKGFYVFDHHKTQYNFDGVLYREIIKTTGVRGGGGHKYWRSDHSQNTPPPNDPDKWNTLAWTCVPGKKEISSDYIYFRSLSAAIAFYNS